MVKYWRSQSLVKAKIEILFVVLKSVRLALSMPLAVRKDPNPFVTVATSDKTCRSHTVKNTSQRKEQTDNAPTDQKEQVTSSVKQILSLQILSLFFFFLKKFKINSVLLLFFGVVTDP